MDKTRKVELTIEEACRQINDQTQGMLRKYTLGCYTRAPSIKKIYKEKETPPHEALPHAEKLSHTLNHSRESAQQEARRQINERMEQETRAASIKKIYKDRKAPPPETLPHTIKVSHTWSHSRESAQQEARR